ncbi:MAG: DUF1566 domain-containing protein [Parabacteroides gordonii]|uniref:Lcl C-terminal domain-containing protein n=1 Tax=Parabacteroides gordonii TaxID=574930 RepID=UPI003A83ED26
MRYVGKICKLLLLLVLCSVDLSAQTATTVSNYPVIDLSALNPLGVVLASADASARRTQMNQQTPSNTTILGVGESVSAHNGTWNAKMSIKYQVMRANHTIGTTDWTTAYNQCKSYNGEGGSAGQWRLPTQRELQMIWILHPQLIGKGSFNAYSTGYYWSSTEYGGSYPNQAWPVDFTNGYTANGVNKTNTYSVRCIRDL